MGAGAAVAKYKPEGGSEGDDAGASEAEGSLWQQYVVKLPQIFVSEEPEDPPEPKPNFYRQLAFVKHEGGSTLAIGDTRNLLAKPSEGFYSAPMQAALLEVVEVSADAPPKPSTYVPAAPRNLYHPPAEVPEVNAEEGEHRGKRLSPADFLPHGKVDHSPTFSPGKMHRTKSPPGSRPASRPSSAIAQPQVQEEHRSPTRRVREAGQERRSLPLLEPGPGSPPGASLRPSPRFGGLSEESGMGSPHRLRRKRSNSHSGAPALWLRGDHGASADGADAPPLRGEEEVAGGSAPPPEVLREMRRHSTPFQGAGTSLPSVVRANRSGGGTPGGSAAMNAESSSEHESPHRRHRTTGGAPIVMSEESSLEREPVHRRHHTTGAPSTLNADASMEQERLQRRLHTTGPAAHLPSAGHARPRVSVCDMAAEFSSEGEARQRRHKTAGAPVRLPPAGVAARGVTDSFPRRQRSLSEAQLSLSPLMRAAQEQAAAQGEPDEDGSWADEWRKHRVDHLDIETGSPVRVGRRARKQAREATREADLKVQAAALAGVAASHAPMPMTENARRKRLEAQLLTDQVGGRKSELHV